MSLQAFRETTFLWGGEETGCMKLGSSFFSCAMGAWLLFLPGSLSCRSESVAAAVLYGVAVGMAPLLVGLLYPSVVRRISQLQQHFLALESKRQQLDSPETVATAAAFSSVSVSAAFSSEGCVVQEFVGLPGNAKASLVGGIERRSGSLDPASSAEAATVGGSTEDAAPSESSFTQKPSAGKGTVATCAMQTDPELQEKPPPVPRRASASLACEEERCVTQHFGFVEFVWL